MDNKALYRIGYGLYVLTAREGGKDNGCIVNTVMQVTSDPLRLVVAVNHANYTNGMIARTGKFNVSVLNENVRSTCSSGSGSLPARIRTSSKVSGMPDAERMTCSTRTHPSSMPCSSAA